ncbi:hypothetical protein B566_EDAN014009 [Ephemera danica]|nr:hypothetical protein B566_EDAN014009 [Ephemera danica]
MLNMYTSEKVLPWQSAAIQSNPDKMDDLITDDDTSNEAVDVDYSEKMRKSQTNIASGPIMSDATQHMTKPPIPAPRHCDVGGVQEALRHETKEKMYSELSSVKESADHFVLYDAPRGNTSEQKDLISFDCDMKFEDASCVLMPYTNFHKQPDSNVIF